MLAMCAGHGEAVYLGAETHNTAMQRKHSQDEDAAADTGRLAFIQ